MQRLVLVEKSVVIRKVAKRILTDLGYLVSEACDRQQALSFCQELTPAVLVVDAGIDGATDLIRTVRELPGGARTKIYYCLIEGKLKPMMQGKRAGADDFLLKPFDRQILTRVFAADARTAA